MRWSWRDSHPELPFDPDRPRHLSPPALGLVFAGGALGTSARYAVGSLIPSVAGWPLATLTVNLVGAFVLGLLLEAVAGRGRPGARVRLLLGTGFCGGFTTYSALATEVELLLRSGAIGVAVGYGLGTVVLGFGFSTIGIWCGARTRTAAPNGTR